MDGTIHRIIITVMQSWDSWVWYNVRMKLLARYRCYLQSFFREQLIHTSSTFRDLSFNLLAKSWSILFVSFPAFAFLCWIFVHTLPSSLFFSSIPLRIKRKRTLIRLRKKGRYRKVPLASFGTGQGRRWNVNFFGGGGSCIFIYSCSDRQTSFQI